MKFAEDSQCVRLIFVHMAIPHAYPYVWTVLISCLNECLTNVARHSRAETVKVALDVTHHDVWLCVENDGVLGVQHRADGIGLRNLRNRTNAISGILCGTSLY